MTKSQVNLAVVVRHAQADAIGHDGRWGHPDFYRTTPARFIGKASPKTVTLVSFNLPETIKMTDTKTDRRTFIKTSAGAAAAVALAGNLPQSPAAEKSVVKGSDHVCIPY